MTPSARRQPPALRYDESATDPSYAQQAAATFTVETYDRNLLLSGTCPRCHQPMQFPVVTDVVRGEEATPGTGQASEPKQITVYCTVEEPRYEGCPDNKSGCGANWHMYLSLD